MFPALGDVTPPSLPTILVAALICGLLVVLGATNLGIAIFCTLALVWGLMFLIDRVL